MSLCDIVEIGTVLQASCNCGGGDLVGFVVATRVGIVVYSRVAGQLVGSAEALAASWKLAGMRLLASMRSNVSGLVLEAVEGSITQRTFVRARKVLALLGVASWVRVILSGDDMRYWVGDGGHIVGGC